MKLPPFESSQWDESIKLKFVTVESLDIEIYYKTSKSLKSNNFFNITSIDMKLLPFDSSQRDDSNKLNFIIIWSLDAEISLFLDFKIFTSKIMQKLTKTYEILRNFMQITQDYGGGVILRKFMPKKNSWCRTGWMLSKLAVWPATA